MPKSKHNKGFSLVELSIVIAIIGVLVGGILVGRSLIRTAEIAEIGIQKEEIVSAINQFRTQYNAFPGDMLDATRYWGTDAGGCPSSTDRTRKKATCNGDGDNWIDSGSPGEIYRVWQHLSNAGLMDTQYSGTPDAAGGSTAGENVPEGALKNTGWEIYWVGGATGLTSNATRPQTVYKHQMFIGTRNSGGIHFQKSLTTGEMYGLDKKIDDGEPFDGRVVAGYWDDCTNASLATSTNVQYLPDTDAPQCMPFFVRLFE